MKRTKMALALWLATLAGAASAAVYSYRGTLRDGADRPLTGVRTLVVALYAEAQGGSPLWQRKITVSLDAKGGFATELSEAVGSAVPGGPTAAIGDVVLANAATGLFLEITVSGSPDTTLPRTALGAVSRAACAENALTASAALDVKGKFAATKRVSCLGAARISADAIAHGDLSVRGDAKIGGDFGVMSGDGSTVSGALTVSNGIAVASATSAGPLAVAGPATTPRVIVTTADFTVGGANAYIAPGTIVMWFLSGVVPDGWVECNGQSYTTSAGEAARSPDLTGRFIVGATGDAESASAYPLGGIGGTRRASLSTDQLPAHAHKYAFTRNDQCMHGGGSLSPYNRKDGLSLSGRADQFAEFSTNNQGGGDNPDHENRPPYRGIRYIMKKF